MIYKFRMSKLIKHVALNIIVKEKHEMKAASLHFKIMHFLLNFTCVFYDKMG